MNTAAEISDYERQRGKPAPSYFHSIIQTNLSVLLRTTLPAHLEALPEVTISLPHRQVTPDIAVFETSKLEETDGDAPATEVMPLLTIELLTIPQTMDALVSRAREFFASGLQSYWIVIPIVKMVLVFTGPDEYKVFHHDQPVLDEVVGLQLPIDQVFDFS